MRLVIGIGQLTSVGPWGIDKGDDRHRTAGVIFCLLCRTVVMNRSPGSIGVGAVLADKANTANLTTEIEISFSAVQWPVFDL